MYEIKINKIKIKAGKYVMSKNKNYIIVNINDLEDLNANEVLLLSIIRCYNLNKKYCTLSIKKLAGMIHCSEKTVNNCLKSLREKELIFTTKVGVNSLHYTKTKIDNNNVKLYVEYFLNADLSARDMIVLSMIENDIDKKVIDKAFSRATAYRTTQKLKELNLIKAEVDAVYERRFYNTSNTKITKISRTNRFNNFTQRNYTKEDFEEYSKIYFN